MNISRLTYKQGVALMTFLSMDEASNKLGCKYNPQANIEIKYPGSKGGIGDYIASFDLGNGLGKLVYSHEMICDYIYSTVSGQPQLYQYFKNILQDTCECGLSCLDRYLGDSYATMLIEAFFWATLQEDINYPCMNGRYRAFYRYAEALGSCDSRNSFNMEGVKERVANVKIGKKKLLIADPPAYYK